MGKRWAAALCAAAMLSGCAANSGTDAGPIPTDYRALIKAYVSRNFFDPYSLRDVATTEPVQANVWRGLANGGRLYAWAVCLRANAKNRMGGYIGVRDTVFMIKNGTIVTSYEDDEFCSAYPHTAWPEMEMAGAVPKS